MLIFINTFETMELDKITHYKTTYFDKRPFLLEDTGVTHRELSHWGGKDLLLTPPDPNKWKRFNLVELAWIRFIAQLRKLNVGLSTIKLIKKELLTDATLHTKNEIFLEAIASINKLDPNYVITEDNKKELRQDIEIYTMSYFESSLYEMLVLETPISVAISIKAGTKEKEIESINDKVFMDLIHWQRIIDQNAIDRFVDTLKSTCVCISLNEILADVFKNTSALKLSKLFSLSPEELKLISEVRKSKYKSVEITFNNENKSNLIITTEKIEITSLAKLLDILSIKDYKDIKMISEAGKVVYFEIKKKIKL